MILKRLSSAIKRQDWFQVIVEILIVIVGIFFGLQAQNWYEARQAEIEEKYIISYLISDMENNINYLDDRVSLYSLRIRQANKVLQILESGKLENEDIETFEEGLFTIGLSGTLDSYLNTFNDNDLDKILDDDLRHIIDNYVGSKNLTKDLVYNSISPNVTAYKALIASKTAIIKDNDRNTIAKVYDFDTLKDDMEYRATYTNILRLTYSVRGRSYNLLQNSKMLLEVLKKHQAGEELGEVTFQ